LSSLFPEFTPYPEGFSYHPDFISVQEENQLIKLIEQQELHAFIFHGYEAKRKAASFGYDYSFEKKSLSEGNEIPAAFRPLIEKTGKLLEIVPDQFKELLILEYPVGAVMNWHRDAPPFDIVVGISLLSDCIFKFRPQDTVKQNRKSVISIPVRRRSLYVMQGESRAEWQHSIPALKQVRYSITLRTLKK
jgi:alkylated DNA repair dioxygenase AlkB